MKTSAQDTSSSFRTAAVRWASPALVLLLLAGVSFVRAHEPEENDADFSIPAALEVPAGNVLEFQAHGVGVQIYAWSAATSTWVFQAPSAVLFHHEGHHVVGIHFAGPSWQANDGSKVVGKRVAAATVDPNSIPWLLLQASSTSGAGTLASTTYIQRILTRGGLAPSTPGSVDGQQVLVPYSAEYLFYRAQ